MRSENGPKQSLVTEETGPHPKIPAPSDGNDGPSFHGEGTCLGGVGLYGGSMASEEERSTRSLETETNIAVVVTAAKALCVALGVLSILFVAGGSVWFALTRF